MNSALLYQKQHHQTAHQIDLDTENTGIRVVQSGKVYRQLFEAQVQLSDAYDKVKEKHREKPPNIKVRDEGIPLIKEGRNLRGIGILDDDSDNWLRAQTNDIYVNNPIFLRHKTDEIRTKLPSPRRQSANDAVTMLPDTVASTFSGSNIEARVDHKRKKKHNECWEDMIQEIALINLNLEPQIKKNGKNVLVQLQDNEKAITELVSFVQELQLPFDSDPRIFEDCKDKLLEHTDVRKEFIDQMDAKFLSIEDERVERIRDIFNKYAEKLFQISYLKKPDIEKLFDAEIQQLNNQILLNKTCYTQLYVKLITGDIEREKNQIAIIDNKRADWRLNALDFEVKNLEAYVDTLNMVKPGNGENKLENDLCHEQHAINENRVGLIDALKNFTPPESTKTAVYKWYESIKEHSKHMDEINTNYVTKLRQSNEENNQKIINKTEKTLKYLMDNKIITVDESKEVLEQRLLPIWSRKQKGIEAHIEKIETDFEELSQIMDKEINVLFKFLQGASHIWDMHEIGLVKKERALQELLQDCRKDHDGDNHKREEKLDSILDQMREASNERDLKKLLVNITMQLESIKRSYHTFNEAQLELVKQYPQMVRDELQRYENQLFTYFSVGRNSDPNVESQNGLASASKETVQVKIEEENENEEEAVVESKPKEPEPKPIEQPATESNIEELTKNFIKTLRGTKLYIKEKPQQTESLAQLVTDLTEKSNMTGSETKSLKKTEFVSRSLNTLKESQTDDNMSEILAFDELIPNTRVDLLDGIEEKHFLRNSVIPLSIITDAKEEVRMNFLNHLENWFEEGILRSSSIVAAKSNEIEKELELRLHLHEPRLNRAEMDVHNVRASEIIMHDERVDRHCAGVEETIEKLKTNFEATQTRLADMSTQNKSDVLNLEVAFLNASKSKILISLHEQLNKQRDKYQDSVKSTLRNFRSELDETLSYIRSSNAKFRVSFTDFTGGGNFSSDEIDVHKKKLEKMALMLDNNETAMLKELEKIEKRYLDEAVKVIVQFQEKFKYHLVDLQFIEKISRWLNETQIKIKTNVNASNLQAKQLSELISEFEKQVDCCRKPNLDKKQVTCEDLVRFVDNLNLKIYERAFFLKCFKNEDIVPTKFAEMFGVENDENEVVAQGNLATSLSSANKKDSQNLTSEAAAHSTNSLSKKGTPNTTNTPIPTLLKSNSKVNAEDAALSIMKTILVKNEQSNLREAEMLGAKSESSIHGQSAKHSSKSKSRLEKEKNAKNKLTRRAKTRDEMYSYYCTFGEFADPGNDFKAQVNNILRDTLEGILTNSEIFYRELQQQNRHPTRPQSIKESYVDFADSMILKLKSYMSQCETYHNQCLKEFRECLTKYEILSSSIPELVIKDIYERNSALLLKEIRHSKNKNLEKLSKFDVEKATNESMLKPNLGHPNMQMKFSQLDKKETERQAAHQKGIIAYSGKLRHSIENSADNFIKELSNTNEMMLIKFDDILTEDDIFKPAIIPEKHETGELIRRQKAGLPLEDAEPKPLIKRQKGSWKGVQSFNINENDSKPITSASINTVKTTLAHRNSSQFVHLYHGKFKEILEENLNYLRSAEAELNYKWEKWSQYWQNSINQIKELYS